MAVSDPPEVPAPTATRQDLQLPRRLFHVCNGTIVATAYALFFSRESIISLLGTIACLVYIVDRVRVAYPEVAGRFAGASSFLLRAEEQFRESAMVPYAIALLLTILTFPKPVALIAIYTLAIADPASAIVGIRFGKHRIVPNKTVEGSLAFLAVSGGVAAGVLLAWAPDVEPWRNLVVAGLLGLVATSIEMVPLRVDDNLTIPITVGFTGWLLCLLFGVPMS